MTGLVRRATLFCALGLMAASAAIAGVPSAGNSPIGSVIHLGGRSGSIVDPLVQKTITVRDAANNPVPNSVVVINFSACTASDIRLCSVQPQAGMFVNCGAKSVSAVTNGSGVATFRIVGGANNPGGAPGVGAGCATVTADGVNLGSLTVSAADQDNAGGYSVLDTAAYMIDRFIGPYKGRSDFGGTGPPHDVLDTAGYFVIRLGLGGPASCSPSPNC